MQVTEIMSREVVLASPQCPLDEAIELFESHRFRHLPVVSEGRLVGMVSDRDVALCTGWLPARDRNRDHGIGPQRVGQIMSEEVESLGEQSSVVQAAETVLEKRIGALPVLRQGAVVGIVTSTDLLRACLDGDQRFDWKIRPDATVAAWMSSEVHTGTPEMSVYEALDICKVRGVRHLPIVRDQKVVGMISNRDLRYGLGKEIVSDRVAQSEGRMEVNETQLSALMAVDVVTINGHDSLSRAATMMLDRQFSALPVLEKGQLVGIITQTDILRSCC